jgi:hypothetical protein
VQAKAEGSKDAHAGEKGASDAGASATAALPDADVPANEAAPGRNATEAARRAKWSGELSRIAKWLESGAADRVGTARTQLDEIRDPAAVPALLRAMMAIKEDNRARIVNALARIPGSEASTALAFVAVADVSEDMRWLAREHLGQRDPGEFRPLLARALGSKNRVAILNAAQAAGEADDVALAPQLTAVLTTEQSDVYVRESPLVTMAFIIAGPPT